MDSKIIIVGGSAGSFQTVLNLISRIPDKYRHTIVFCLHRLKSVKKGFAEALNVKSSNPVTEPYDKEKIKAGRLYLAPSNYHLIIEEDKTFSLSTECVINHSRPSIDLTFSSAGRVYGKQATGVLLSGANRDGSAGLKIMEEFGSKIIIQNPCDCQVDTMPKYGVENTSKAILLNTCEIVEYILNHE
jgi:two-component system chemotaxis response regulator CheB